MQAFANLSDSVLSGALLSVEANRSAVPAGYARGWWPRSDFGRRGAVGMIPNVAVSPPSFG